MIRVKVETPLLKRVTWEDMDKELIKDVPMNSSFLPKTKAKLNREAWRHYQTMNNLDIQQEECKQRRKKEIEKLHTEVARMKARGYVCKMHAFKQYDPFLDVPVQEKKTRKPSKIKTTGSKSDKHKKTLKKKKDAMKTNATALESKKTISSDVKLQDEGTEQPVIDRTKSRKHSKRKKGQAITKVIMPTIFEDCIETQMSHLNTTGDSSSSTKEVDESNFDKSLEKTSNDYEHTENLDCNVFSDVGQLTIENVDIFNDKSNVSRKENPPENAQEQQQISLFPISGDLVKNMFGWQVKVDKTALPEVYDPSKRKKKRIVKPLPRPKSMFPYEFNSVYSLNKFYEAETDKVLKDGERIITTKRDSHDNFNKLKRPERLRRMKTSPAGFLTHGSTSKALHHKSREQTI